MFLNVQVAHSKCVSLWSNHITSGIKVLQFTVHHVSECVGGVCEGVLGVCGDGVREEGVRGMCSQCEASVCVCVYM